MPSTIDPKQTINIWSVLKDMVGKDLSKIAVPGIFPLTLTY